MITFIVSFRVFGVDFKYFRDNNHAIKHKDFFKGWQKEGDCIGQGSNFDQTDSTHGSYLERPKQTGVGKNSAMNHDSSVPLGQDSTTTIIFMLQKLSESNQSLMQRVKKIEQRNSSDCVTIDRPAQLSEHPEQGHKPMASTSRLPQPQLLHTNL